ncbi:MAG: flagellar assembly protein FliW [Nitrospirae bacterium]|nr:flagellar assembly protein FliW [Nitrospirota bacterium]
MIEFNTSRFGKLTVEEDRVINFPGGLIGLPALKRYVLIDYKDTEIKWLQSVDDPEVAFIVVEPFVLDRNYQLTLSDSVVEQLQLKDPKDLAILIILRVEDGKVIANFQGPLVINSSNKTGAQIIVETASIVTYNNIETVQKG